MTNLQNIIIVIKLKKQNTNESNKTNWAFYFKTNKVHGGRFTVSTNKHSDNLIKLCRFR